MLEIIKDNTSTCVGVEYGEVIITYSDVVFSGGVEFPVEQWQEIREYIDKQISKSFVSKGE